MHARMCVWCVYACMHVCMYDACMHACMHAHTRSGVLENVTAASPKPKPPLTEFDDYCGVNTPFMANFTLPIVQGPARTTPEAGTGSSRQSPSCCRLRVGTKFRREGSHVCRLGPSGGSQGAQISSRQTNTIRREVPVSARSRALSSLHIHPSTYLFKYFF